MHYQISRNGQTYGPYTLEDLQRYVASGNVLPTDMAKSDEMPDWIPVSQLLSGTVAPPPAFTAPPDYGQPVATFSASAYPESPNLHWGLVVLFCFLTCGLFMPIWNLVVSAWLRRVQPTAMALFYYLATLALIGVNWVIGLAGAAHQFMQPGFHLGPNLALRISLGIVIWVVRLVARYSERASLEQHFNTVEPMGLRLDPVMTFFFGGVYFQYHLNRINSLKLAARFGAGRGY